MLVSHDSVSQTPQTLQTKTGHTETVKGIFCCQSVKPAAFVFAVLCFWSDTHAYIFVSLSWLWLARRRRRGARQCGSCWAFASTATLESHLSLSTGRHEDLAPQNFVSCAPNDDSCGGTGGCFGSTADVAYGWLAADAANGLASAFTYGYSSGIGGETGDCASERAIPVANVSGFGKPTSNDYVSRRVIRAGEIITSEPDRAETAPPPPEDARVTSHTHLAFRARRFDPNLTAPLHQQHTRATRTRYSTRSRRSARSRSTSTRLRGAITRRACTTAATTTPTLRSTTSSSPRATASTRLRGSASGSSATRGRPRTLST